MIEQVEFDDDFDGLKVKLNDILELRAREYEYEGNHRVDIRIWKFMRSKITNQLRFIPQSKGVYMDWSIFKYDLEPYLNKLVREDD